MIITTSIATTNASNINTAIMLPATILIILAAFYQTYLLKDIFHINLKNIIFKLRHILLVSHM